MKIGITGQSGFIGSQLHDRLRLNPDFEIISFEDRFFDHGRMLSDFVRQCDVIIHLAAMNRSEDQQLIYDTNIGLVNTLIEAMEREGVKPHVLFSSSTQESLDNKYGESKKHGRELLEQWATRNGAAFTALIVPNVFGEFARPDYNTFVATFAQRIVNGEQPRVIQDNAIRLIYVGSLCRFIAGQFSERGVRKVEVPWDMECKVSEIMSLFERFRDDYLKADVIPELRNMNDVNLFNTFRSYIDPAVHFPVKLKVNSDQRGDFIETVRSRTAGQMSFSTTMPGITRGNHYHTRKIERFIVVRGRAKIQLRRIGTDTVLEFELDGSVPSYVDMPIWYTHNITNIGREELYTQFWINEWFSPQDGDTYFEKV